MTIATQADLSALYPRVDTGTVEVQNIPLHEIEDVPVSPPGALVASLDSRGLLQPITLSSSRMDGLLVVVDGRRRLAAARHLGWSTIRAQVLSLDPITEAATAIAANAVRSENPLSDLAAIRELADRGYSETDIATATGLRIGTIRKRMKLTTLPEQLWKGVQDGKIAIGIGEQIAGAPPSVQADLVDVLREHGRVTGVHVREARSAVREAATVELAGLIPTPVERDRMEDFADELAELIRRYYVDLTYDDLLMVAATAWESMREDGQQ